MLPLKWSVPISVFLLLISRTSSRPLEEEEEGLGEGKKINDEDVRGIIEDLETHVAKIPLEHFVGDTKLHQVVDPLNDVTSYKANGTESKEASIYERKSDDKDKKVIVLKPSEDKITVRFSKKTYVGLRHSGEGDTYYVFYIYIREASPGDEFAKKIGGEEKLIEYDAWENREDKLQKVNNGFGWSECSSSIFIPCKTNESTGFAPPRVDHRKKKNETEEAPAKPAPKPEGTFKTEVGFEANENIDFFWDLEDDIQKARFIGIGLDLMAGGLSAIPNLLTGVFGGVAQGVSGLLSGVLGTASNLVSGVIGGGMNAISGIVGAAGNMVSGALGSIMNIGGSLFGGGSGGGGITAGIGGGISAALNLGTSFLGGMANMVGTGLNAAVSAGTGLINGVMQAGTGLLSAGINMGSSLLNVGLNIGGGGGGGGDLIGGLMNTATGMLSGVMNAGMGLVNGVVGGITNLVTGLFQAGMGLVNSLLNFGGLGGAKAKASDVGLALGINLNLGGSAQGGGGFLTDEDEQDVEEGIKNPASGGMGGLLSLDISLEADGDAGGGGGAQGRSIGAMGVPAEEPTEEERAQMEGRALLTAKLATVIATKMGENFGKELMKTGLIEHPGWKTMDEAGEAGNTLTHEDDAFVGFGGCEYKKVTKKDVEGAKSASDLLKLLTTALRTQCVSKEIKFYETLISENFLRFNEADKTFDVPQENKYLHMDKLIPKRRSDLARAFELSLFSKSFKAELHADNPHSAPKHSSISRRVHTFGEVVINGIQLAGKEFKCHQVKILRSLLTTVKAAFTKLIQDYEATKECGACEEELRVNKNDQKYLMTLMEFILHGLAPVQKKWEGVKDALKIFNETNGDVISNRVENYLL